MMMINKYVGREGEWTWLHSGLELGDDLWAAHRPVNKSKNSEDCVVMVLRNNLVTWEDHR